MSCPTPSDFQALIIDQNSSVCEALSKLGPASRLWFDAYSCIYNENLSFTEAFKAKICATGCGGGGGGTSTSTTPSGSGSANFTSSQDWTVPDGVNEITVTVVAGGGAGGGGTCEFCFAPYTGVGSGGGSGEKRVHTFAVTPGDTVTIVVGSGGVGGVFNGGSGQVSSVSYGAEYVLAVGGSGGTYGACNVARAGGAGGSGGSGGIGTSGNAGGASLAYPPTCGAGSGGASVGLAKGGGGAGGSGSGAAGTSGTDGAVRIVW